MPGKLDVIIEECDEIVEITVTGEGIPGPQGPQGEQGEIGPQGPATSWGLITGDVADQTDLGSAAAVDASADPTPDTIPIARESAKIDGEWVDGAGISGVPLAGINGLSFALDALRAATLEARYGDGPYPTLDLQFAGATMLDPRVDFTRGSEATGWVNGQLKTFGINEPRFVTDPTTGYSGLMLEPFSSTNLAENSLSLIERVWGSSWDVTPIPNVDGTMTAARLTALGVAISAVTLATMPAQRELTVTQITRERVPFDSGPEPLIRGRIRNNTRSTNAVPGAYNTATNTTSGPCVSGRHLGGGWWETVFVYTEEDLPDLTEEGDSLRWYFTISTANTEGDVVDVAGLQIEPGTKSTSFIHTGDSQVTRAGDFFTLPAGYWYRPDQGTLVVSAATRVGETVATFGDIVIVSDSDEMKTYTVPYSSPTGATQLDLGAGLFSSVQYYPQVLS